MIPKDIVFRLQKLFDPTVSPGQAFDALFQMRQERVMWEDVYRAVTSTGKAQHVALRLDESEEAPTPPSPHLAKAASDNKFRNPRLGFGRYRGKTLTEVAEINPGYLTELERTGEPFWREQAVLAKIAIESAAPPHKDTSDTGFFSKG